MRKTVDTRLLFLLERKRAPRAYKGLGKRLVGVRVSGSAVALSIYSALLINGPHPSQTKVVHISSWFIYQINSVTYIIQCNTWLMIQLY